MEKNQYFMYGTLVSYQAYLDLRTLYVLDDVFKPDNDIQGIFTGRDAEFIIVGRVLDTVEDDGKAQVIPELNDAEICVVRGLVEQKYGITGNFHYYFITKNK